MPSSDAVWWSPRAELAGAAAAERLRHTLRGSPICLVPRRLEPWLCAALDGLPAGLLPRFDAYGPLDRVLAAIEGIAPLHPSGSLGWLRDDVVALTTLVATACEGVPVRATMRVGEADADPDQMGIGGPYTCLVTTYRGPGTVWHRVRGASCAAEPPTFPIERGTVAILAADDPEAAPSPIGHHVPHVATGNDRLMLVVKAAMPLT